VRIAIYGGSFNPPHVGHALVAAWVRWTGHADVVWFLPVFRHAFEETHGKVLAPFGDRVAWCEAMVRDLGEGVAVCTVESELPIPSYSIDTLRALAVRHPQHCFRLVVGADVLPEVGSWRDWDAISAQFDPIIVGRRGYPTPSHAPTVEFPDVSSSDIRQRHRDGRPMKYLLTASVYEALATWRGAW
jgi:nicotinate-nucleotide adenylyltransferase